MDVYAIAMLIFPFMLLYAAGISIYNNYVDKKNEGKD